MRVMLNVKICTRDFWFAGQDVNGVLDSAAVDTSILEQYLSNDIDPTLWVPSTFAFFFIYSFLIHNKYINTT